MFASYAGRGRIWEQVERWRTVDAARTVPASTPRLRLVAIWVLVLVLGPGLVRAAVAQTVFLQWDRGPCALATDCPPAPTHFYLYRDLVYVGKLAVSMTLLTGEVLQWAFEATAATHWFGVSAVNEAIATTPLESDIVQIQWCVDGSCAANPSTDTTDDKGSHGSKGKGRGR